MRTHDWRVMSGRSSAHGSPRLLPSGNPMSHRRLYSGRVEDQGKVGDLFRVG